MKRLLKPTSKIVLPLLMTLGQALLLNNQVKAQESPLFGQTITSSFLYNPALAGYEKGSLTMSSRQTFAEDFAGLPSTNFLSFQSPFELGKLGFGGNMIYGQMGVFREIQGNMSGSYHIRWKDKMTWSMGLGTDFYNASINQSRLDVLDYDDQEIKDFAKTEIDFSGGVYFSYKFIGAGLAVNRLRSWLDQKDILSNYANVFIKGSFELSSNIIWQPILIYRKTREYEPQMDAGFLVFYKDSFLSGFNYRSNGQVGISLGARLNDKIWAAYTYDLFTHYNMASHEITLRFDFNQSRFPNTVSNYKQIEGKNKYRRWKHQLKKNKLKSSDSEILDN